MLVIACERARERDVANCGESGKPLTASFSPKDREAVRFVP